MIYEGKFDNWPYNKNKLKKTIERNYKKAPMFSDVFPILDKIIECETDNISDFNKNCVIEICKYLDMDTNIETDSSKYLDIEIELQNNDPRYKEISTKIERALRICHLEKADTFHNAIGGVELYPKDVFLENNITVKFIHTTFSDYKQFNSSFVPMLSIIDVMMFNESGSVKKMLDNYELI